MKERVILFPTDFSERSVKALGEALEFADRFKDKMIIFHSYTRPYVEGATPEESKSLLRQLEEQIDHKFEKIVQDLPKLKSLNHEFRKAVGTSAENIAEVTNTQKIDLIIMATKGARGFGELWGTTTAKIIKSVETPVLVIPDKSTLSNVTKVALTCDYSERIDYRKLEFLVEVAETQNSDIEVITLNREEKLMTNQELAHQEQVKRQLQSVQTSFSFYFCENIEEGIIDYAKQHNIGIIAIMPKSYTYIERLFHESLTERMAFHSPVPLLVLK